MNAPNHSDQDTDAGVRNPGRRDFLKTTAIGAAAGAAGLGLHSGAALAQAESAGSMATSQGIIYADPENLSNNVPLSKVLEITEFLNAPENRVQIQFPSDKTQYAWVNMSRFYPTAQVRRDGPISELGYQIDPGIGEVSYQNQKGETLTVNSHFETLPIDALIVVKGGNVLYERYRTMAPTDKHMLFSCSKITGSTLLAFLEQEGKIDVDRPVSDYVEELKGSVWDTVRLVEALDMATGLDGTEHDEPNGDSRTNPDQIWYRWAATQAVGVLGDVKQRNEQWYDVLRSMQRRKPAYEVFEYNSINTFVMNRTVERIADQPLNEQFSDRFWSKLGMEHDSYYMCAPNGFTLGFMGLNPTLRDFARFGMAFTPSSTKLAGERLVPQAILDKIQDMTHADMYGKGFVGKSKMPHFPNDPVIANRYQWDAVFPDGDFIKYGVGGQGLYISPATDTVVVWLCTSDGTNPEDTMARAIVKSLS
jgi:CubicO group peptidase (beta-lactamase class C family)